MVAEEFGVWTRKMLDPTAQSSPLKSMVTQLVIQGPHACVVDILVKGEGGTTRPGEFTCVCLPPRALVSVLGGGSDSAPHPRAVVRLWMAQTGTWRLSPPLSAVSLFFPWPPSQLSPSGIIKSWKCPASGARASTPVCPDLSLFPVPAYLQAPPLLHWPLEVTCTLPRAPDS